MQDRATLEAIRADVDQALALLDRLQPVISAYRTPPAGPELTAKPAKAPGSRATSAPTQTKRRDALPAAGRKKLWRERQKAASQEAPQGPPEGEADPTADHPRQPDLAHEAPAEQDGGKVSAAASGNGGSRRSKLLASSSLAGADAAESWERPFRVPLDGEAERAEHLRCPPVGIPAIDGAARV